MASAAPPEGERENWDLIGEYCNKSLRLKADRWHKAVQHGDTRTNILKFFDGETEQLIIGQNTANQLVASQEVSAGLRTKAVFFLKNTDEPLVREEENSNVRENIILGDISPQPLDHLSTLIEEILIPILENPKNQNGWPGMVEEDILQQVYSLRGTVYRMWGQLRGQTLLPLPFGMEILKEAERLALDTGEMTDSQLKSGIESVVIKWVHQIEEVLRQDSDEIATAGNFPLPLQELAFWIKRRDNLSHIAQQLKNCKVGMMSNILEVTESAYYKPFINMRTDVILGVRETRDIVLHLSPLKPQFETLESTELSEVLPLLRPLMHCLCLLWVKCSSYRKPDRIVTLFKEVTNLLINMVRSFIGIVAFQADTQESLLKIDVSISVLKNFRELFEEHRRKIPDYFSDGDDVWTWEFHPTHAFSRMDSFLVRMNDIRDIFEIAREFLKIEKIEFGGPKGKVLGTKLFSIFSEFHEAYTAFSISTYDCLAPEEKEFEQGYKQFCRKVSHLEQRLSLVVSQALKKTQNPEAFFKVVELLGTMVMRPILRDEYLKCVAHLMKLLRSELEEAKGIFENWRSNYELAKREEAKKSECTVKSFQIDTLGTSEELSLASDVNYAPAPATNIFCYKNFPPLVGNLKFIQQVKSRVESNMNRLFLTQHMMPCSDEVISLKAFWEEFLQDLENTAANLEREWNDLAEKDHSKALEEPLLKIDNGKLVVNFSDQLVEALQEMKYNWVLGRSLDSSQVSQKREIFRQYRANLQLMVEWYNQIQTSTSEVELSLISAEMEEINKSVRRGCSDLTWDFDVAWSYIENLRDRVCDLESRVTKAQENVLHLNTIVDSWVSQLVYERKDGKKDALLSLDDKKERLKKIYNRISKDGEAVRNLVEENQMLLRVEGTSLHWDRYLLIFDHQVGRGLADSVHCSLSYFLEHTENQPGVSPFLESLLVLEDPDLTLYPSPEELENLAESLINDVLHISSLVPRLAKNQGSPSYESELERDEEIQYLKQRILDRFRSVAQQMSEFKVTFLKYQSIWYDCREEALDTFVSSGPDRIQPSLAQFKEKIDSYELLYVNLESIEEQRVFDQWMRLDLRPFKHELLISCKKWSLIFKRFLINEVIDSITNLDEFIRNTESGINQDLDDGDYNVLVSIMAHLVAVRERLKATDAMFEPLKAKIALVQQYEEDLPETMHLKLQELPERWESLKKQCDLARQNVAPLKANEVSGIRGKCNKFEAKQINYREKFKSYSIFKFECQLPYWRLEKVQERVLCLEAEMTQIQESALLFDVSIPDFKYVKSCRKDIRLLKQLWDHIILVQSSVNFWKKTTWREVDVENMDIECKKFAKDIRALDKEMRCWDAYVNLDNTVKNTLTSVRAVGELQNSALRDRHWVQLMKACKQSDPENEDTVPRFVHDRSTTLADLLQLNLHIYEDEVKNIVDKAVKEMTMEKILKDLETTWSVMTFEFDIHTRTKIKLIRTSEEMIETLEENQVQLQNLMTSKYIDHFLDAVSRWQQKLSLADQVISMWFEVQRTWSYLESIFIGSDDIRQQLPKDSKRFDQIDGNFKRMVQSVVNEALILKATSQPGILNCLEDLQKELTVCEKTLAEYLETKRLAFPRFYFVSTSDLLDILSNGNQPLKIAKHLTKLFDSIAKLEFEGSDSTMANMATGMHAKDGEYIPFTERTSCEGPVEIWLQRILLAMKTTIRDRMTEAVAAYEDRKREQWVSEYPAQVALTGTQIWWTVEVNGAFSQLEEGYENALRDYYKKQVQQLNNLISLLLGELTRQERQKIMTICTIDVHARDVVSKLIAQKVDSANAFAWQSQLRHRWNEEQRNCFVNICDAHFAYDHEYLGNTPRLVITPLTDRCYITLTQSLHLGMGGAPSGPAGTGKTETTKDLGRALGMMVYVFNCSEQMDYKSCGNIYKGLAQTGSWGCFDEFNRISVEVLSVVAVQVKCVQDAISQKKVEFDFMGEMIPFVSTIGIFITMNPGYAGRTELPENLKVLFRPCAMVVPDLELICEIMLVAEGFLEAKTLARKFITLYNLCKELLSKQDHYDWGLRAIKSLLVVAGSLKRDDPTRPEDQVLMRALRDYNVPKIVSDDIPVFMGLIGDLFPALDVPRKKDTDFEKAVKDAACDLKLQPEDSFILKVVQLKELLEVRHSVFIIGGAGTGKTQVLRTLLRTYYNMKKKPIVFDLNPKAVTTDELFGVINPATREWKDGLFSNVMREQANMTGENPKWIILDGDIDPMWIESLNTLMDDNKILTLASNERISLTPHMRLLFEVSNLRTATPATVSRAGIIYLNQQDLGWNPYVTSWVDTRECENEKTHLMVLMDKYIPTCLDVLKVRFKKMVPVPEISHLMMLCQLLDCLLAPENIPVDCTKETYELHFVFAAVWAFGSTMYQDGNIDYRVEFSKWWQQEFKTVKFPSEGTVFDFYIDRETLKFVHWKEKVPKFDLDPDAPLQYPSSGETGDVIECVIGYLADGVCANASVPGESPNFLSAPTRKETQALEVLRQKQRLKMRGNW